MKLKLLSIALILIIVLPLCAFTDGNLVSPSDYDSSIGAIMARMNNGEIFAVVMAGNNTPDYGWHAEDTVIQKTTSTDNGSTWATPEILVNKGTDWGCGGGVSLVYDSSNNTLFCAFTHFKNYNDNQIYIMHSYDYGNTWSTPEWINTGNAYEGLSAVGIQLTNGTLVIPHEWDIKPSLSEYDIRCGILLSNDGGNTWQSKGNIGFPNSVAGADEMAICEFGTNSILALLRTQTGLLSGATSNNTGNTWDLFQLPFQSADSPASLMRLNNKIYAVWNNSNDRQHLSIMQTDDTLVWHDPLEITGDSYSAYPFMVDTGNNSLLITYWSTHGMLSNKFQSVIVDIADIPTSGNFTSHVPPAQAPTPSPPIPDGGGSYAPSSSSGDSGGLNFGGLTLNEHGVVVWDKQIMSRQGDVELTVDAGVYPLDANGNTFRIIRIDDASENISGNMTTVYDLKPNGATFKPYVTLKFTTSENMSVVSWNGTAWEALESVFDAKAHVITVKITHFSKYALIATQKTDEAQPEITPEIVFILEPVKPKYNFWIEWLQDYFMRLDK